MNIFGETFPTEIIDQILLRQNIVARGFTTNAILQIDADPNNPNGQIDTFNLNYYSDYDIQYLNGNSSWCKLVSGVDISSSKDINNPTIKSLGFNDNKLAEKFVLFNGLYDASKKQQYSGISTSWDSTDIIPTKNSAYGLGGKEFGLKPIPGIISANIKHENRGSLRRAEVKIKAFNRAQFEIIDALYMRLGFTVLLEWGHSIIAKNSQFYFNPQFSLMTDFLNGTYNSYEFLDKIQNNRLTSAGNYDAMFAKVSNFSWNYNSDGSYDITINLISIGDIIESLNVYVMTGAAGSVAPDNDANKRVNDVFEKDISGEIIDGFAYHSTIGNFLYGCKNLIDNAYEKNLLQNFGTTEFSRAIPLCSTNASTQAIIESSFHVPPVFDSFNLTSTIIDANHEDVLKLVFDDLGGATFDWTNPFSAIDDKRYYIRLGAFFDFLNDYIIPTSYDKQGLRSKTTLIDTDSSTNIITSNIFQVSSDPRVCYIVREIDWPSLNVNLNPYIYGLKNVDNPSPFIDEGLTKHIKSKHPNEKNIEYGRIMNIHVEMTFILKTLYNNQKNGELKLIDFLQSLLSGISESTGGINDFDIYYDDFTNFIKIIDKNPLPYVDEVVAYLNTTYLANVKVYNNDRSLNEDNRTIFKLTGLTNGGGSIIKNFNLKTEISPNFSTMVTVGAAARGTVVGENDTALSKLNYGFVDRYKEAITNSPSAGTTQDYAKDYNNKLAEYNSLWGEYTNYLWRSSNHQHSNIEKITAQAEDIEGNKTKLNNLIQKAYEVNQAEKYFNTGSAGSDNSYRSGFLPFNLNFSLNGISGIKINQQCTIDTNFLPTNYPNSMRFLVKGLSHEIANNMWTTHIETYSVTKPTDSRNIVRQPTTPNNNSNNNNNNNNSNNNNNNTTNNLGGGWFNL